MHSRIGPPRPPGFCSSFKLAHTVQPESAAQAQICRGEGIWITESPHGDVLRGPSSEARNTAQLFKRFLRIGHHFETDFVIQREVGKFSNRSSARLWQSDRGDVGLGKNLGLRKDMCEPVAHGERLSKFVHQTAGKCGSAAHGDLLA